jgi:zinc transport system substrate-binding protein
VKYLFGSVRAAAIVIFALALGPAGCRPAPPQETAGLKVAATIQPLASIVGEILGDRGTVSALLPPGASPHTFEPLPGDLARLEGTVLLVRIGVGIDQWSERLLAASSAPLTTVTFLDLPDARPRKWGDGDTRAHGDTGEAGQGGLDPHIWLDPIRVRDALVPAVAEALATADPSGSQAYRLRAREYAERLAELDGEIRAQLGDAEKRAFIAYHDTWRYFAQRYELEQVASIEAYAGDEPTPAELGRLVALARANKITAVIMEPQLGERVARNIADEIGAVLETADPLGDPSEPARADYLSTMRFSAHAFARALGAPRP